MLQITIPSAELWDYKKNEFHYTKEYVLNLEHSLVSIAKWESKWQKPFLSKSNKTIEETRDYIRCMTLTQNIPDDAYMYLTSENIQQVNDYIDEPMTATWFSNNNHTKNSNEQVTSELIYYWMIAFNVPFECQKWHFNRLLALIRVCEIKSSPPKKQKTSEILSRNAALNAARRRQLNTKG